MNNWARRVSQPGFSIRWNKGHMTNQYHSRQAYEKSNWHWTEEIWILLEKWRKKMFDIRADRKKRNYKIVFCINLYRWFKDNVKAYNYWWKRALNLILLLWKRSSSMPAFIDSGIKYPHFDPTSSSIWTKRPSRRRSLMLINWAMSLSLTSSYNSLIRKRKLFLTHTDL